MKALVLRRFPEGYYLLPGSPKAFAKLLRSRSAGPVNVEAGVAPSAPVPLVEVGDLDSIFLAELEAPPAERVKVQFLPREWGGSLVEGEGEAYSALAEWETLAYLAEQAGL